MISATCFQDNNYCIFFVILGPPQPMVNSSLTNVLPQYQAQRPALNGVGNNSLQRPGGPSTTTSFGPTVSKNFPKMRSKLHHLSTQSLKNIFPSILIGT